MPLERSSSSPVQESKEAQVRDAGAEVSRIDANLQDHLALQKEAVLSSIKLYLGMQSWDRKSSKNLGKKKKNPGLENLTFKRLLNVCSSNLLFYRWRNHG